MKAIIENKKDNIHKREKLTCVATRTLILMSFIDDNITSLHYIMCTVGIRTFNDQKEFINEIFRFIQRGVLYIPSGLLTLIEKRYTIFKNANQLHKIKIHLLRPLEPLFTEIEKEFLK
jgi:ubiquinone/menaquinone biosynthesis C-methylase UbiE